MKKLAILLLTIFTMCTVAACGCSEAKENSSFENRNRIESIQIQDTEKENDEQNEQDKPECPDREERDGECPQPRRPHKRHNKTLPRPKTAYHK